MTEKMRFQYELKFPWDNPYLKVHKIRPDKDILHYFSVEKPRNWLVQKKKGREG